MARYTGAALVLAMTLLLPVAPARAADDFADAMAAYELGDDELALRAFERAAKAKNRTPADLLAIHTYAGVAAFRLGDQRKAEASFRRAIELDASVVAPYEAPDGAKELLEKLKAGGGSPAPSGPATFKVKRTEEVEAGQPVRVRVERTQGEIAGVVAFHRVGTGAWRQAELSESGVGVWEGELPSTEEGVDVADVEFYLEARDEAGSTVARFGSEGTPKVTRVRGGTMGSTPEPEPQPRPEPRIAPPVDFVNPDDAVAPDDDRTRIWQTWWFWTGVGLVVAGGGAAAYFLLAEPESTAVPCNETSAGTGCIDVTVTGLVPMQGVTW